jgi:hypothetical protein
MNNGDWLHIYANAIKQHDMNMDSIMRTAIAVKNDEGTPQARMLADMQSVFGNKQLSWENLADYSQFLSTLHDTGHTVTYAKGAQASYEAVSDYVVKQLDIVDGEELLRSQSMYEMITHTKKNFN